MKKDLISTLLQTEQFPKPDALFSLLQGVLLVLPSIACVAVGWYIFYAHFRPPLNSVPLLELIIKNQHSARWLDGAGAIFAVLVLLCNFVAVFFFITTRNTLKNCLPATSKAGHSAKAEAAGA